MAGRFEGKVAIVTGASRGIGASVGRMLAEEGAAVVLVARGKKALDGVVASITARGGRADAIAADLSTIAACEKLVASVTNELGRIDVLINNAGLNHRGPIESHAPEALASIVHLNLVTPIVLTRLVLPGMRRRGGGAVVNVASIAGMVPLGHEAVYSATKFGLRAFGFALADELEGSGVRVSAVSPGPVETEFILEELDEVPDLVFSQPMSTADEVAKLVIECVADGEPERVIPRSTALLARLGATFPAVQNALRPYLEAQGKKVKDGYRKKRAAPTPSPTPPPTPTGEA